MELKTSYSYGVDKPVRQSILNLEASVRDMPDSLDEVELEQEYNTHFFAPGVYGRQMLIPAGMCVVGKIHKHAHINVITKGVIKVVTEFGVDIYTGPRTWVSESGTKRAVYALEDTVWLTIHANPDDSTDIRELEEQVIAPDFETFDRLKLGPGAPL
jgi:hypothetical protein